MNTSNPTSPSYTLDPKTIELYKNIRGMDIAQSVLCLILLLIVFIITIKVFKMIKFKDKILLCSLVMLNLTLVSKIATALIAIDLNTKIIN